MKDNFQNVLFSFGNWRTVRAAPLFSLGEEQTLSECVSFPRKKESHPKKRPARGLRGDRFIELREDEREEKRHDEKEERR